MLTYLGVGGSSVLLAWHVATESCKKERHDVERYRGYSRGYSKSHLINTCFLIRIPPLLPQWMKHHVSGFLPWGMIWCNAVTMAWGNVSDFMDVTMGPYTFQCHSPLNIRSSSPDLDYRQTLSKVFHEFYPPPSLCQAPMVPGIIPGRHL